MKLDEYSYETFEIGPFWITVSADFTNTLVIWYAIEDRSYCVEKFVGETLTDARNQAAQRCITIFEKWAKEAKEL